MAPSLLPALTHYVHAQGHPGGGDQRHRGRWPTEDARNPRSLRPRHDPRFTGGFLLRRALGEEDGTPQETGMTWGKREARLPGGGAWRRSRDRLVGGPSGSVGGPQRRGSTAPLAPS